MCHRGLVEVGKDLTAGTMAGIAQLLVGHPFDTVKVKLQSQMNSGSHGQPNPSAVDTVKKIMATEGLRGLYRGLSAPLASVALFNAVLFTARGQMETFLLRNSRSCTTLTIPQQMVAGAGAGFAVSFVACPTELVKCRLQAQSNSTPSLITPGEEDKVPYGGCLDVAKHIFRQGGILGFYKGLTPTFLREVFGNAAYFGSYQGTKQLEGGSASNLGTGSLLLAGAVAGAMFWLCVYPADVIKSVIQVDDYTNPKYTSTFDAFRKVIKSRGVKGLYCGFGPAMARSILANAVCFFVYELVRKALK
uniref:Predicted protein n=1 Tax=Physcomitrium patens TaxID=3218 RepID=A9U4Q7_PHYPA